MPNFFDKYPYTDFHELNLDWILETVKKLAAEWAETLTEWHNTREEWQQLYDYVHDYFDNLDVQSEINTKINEMADDGTLVALITPVIESKVATITPGIIVEELPAAVADQIDGVVATQIDASVASQISAPVSDWLDDHITQPTTPAIDASLSVQGAAADAEKTGLMVTDVYSVGSAYSINNYVNYNGDIYRCISDISTPEAWTAAHWKKVSIGSDLSALKSDYDFYVKPDINKHKDLLTLTYTANERIDPTGAISTAGDNNYCVSDPVSVSAGERFEINLTLLWNNLVVAFYDSTDTFISGVVTYDGVNIGSNRYQFTDYEVIAPAGASTVRFAWHSNYVHEIYQIVGSDFMTSEFYDLEEAFSRAIVPNVCVQNMTLDLTLTDGCYIDFSGIEHTDAGTAWKTSSPVPCTYGEKYLYTGYMNYNQCIVAFYDSNNTFIDYISADQGTVISPNLYYFDAYEFTIPKEVHSIRFGCWKSGAYQDFEAVREAIKFNPDSTAEWIDKKWVVVGDSLSDPTSGKATKYYFDYIAEKTGITLHNMAISGSGYARKQDTNQAFYQTILNCPIDADVITIFGSFNDLGAGLPLGTVTDHNTTTLAGCINTTLDNLYSIYPLANVGLVAPCPWDTRWPGGLYHDTTNDYVNMIKQICEYRSVPFFNMYRHSGLHPWDPTFKQAAYTRDGGGGTHPDENGHAILAPKFEAFLDELLLH